MRTPSWGMLAALAACTSTDPSIAYVARDPCAPLAITATAPSAAQQTAIDDAFALWRAHGVTALDPGAPSAPNGSAPTGDPAIAIEFDQAGAAFHGQYDPAANRVLINRDLTDRTALSIVIAHELGHVFGLVHVPPATRLSLMNPGNLVTPPTAADEAALQALWGACQGAAP